MHAASIEVLQAQLGKLVDAVNELHVSHAPPVRAPVVQTVLSAPFSFYLLVYRYSPASPDGDPWQILVLPEHEANDMSNFIRTILAQPLNALPSASVSGYFGGEPVRDSEYHCQRRFVPAAR